MKTAVFVESRRSPIVMYAIVSIMFVAMLMFCAIGLMTRGEFVDSVELSKSAVAVTAPRSTALPRLVVNVESDGRLVVAGRRVESRELEAMFRTEQSKSTTKQMELMIRADRSATYDMVTPVLSAAIHANVSRINFAVRTASGREDVRSISPP